MRRLRLALFLLASVFSQPANAGELEDRFLLAVRTGDVAGVKAALGAGVNVKTPSSGMIAWLCPSLPTGGTRKW